MNISALAKHYNISVRTIRYYEEKGLIISYRNEQNIREFTPDIINRLELILFFRDLDFPISDIGFMLDHHNSSSIKPYLLKHLQRISQQVDTLNNTIHILESVMKVMSHKQGNLYCVDDFIQEQIYFQSNNERMVTHMNRTNNIVLEIGKSLIPLADEKQCGLLIKSVKNMRQDIETTTQQQVSLIRVKDNLQDLDHFTYRILKDSNVLTIHTFTSETHADAMISTMTRDLKTVILSHLHYTN